MRESEEETAFAVGYLHEGGRIVNAAFETRPRLRIYADDLLLKQIIDRFGYLFGLLDDDDLSLEDLYGQFLQCLFVNMRYRIPQFKFMISNFKFIIYFRCL